MWYSCFQMTSAPLSEFSRTPSYRPPRRRQYGRLRRFSPYRPYRGSRGAPYVSTLPRRDSHSPLKGAGGPPSLPQRPARLLPSSTATKTMGSGGGSPLAGRIPPLNERFEGLLEATLRQRRREYGVPGGLAYLLLTNRLKLPLPTLMREAKELSVVIERNLPPGLCFVVLPLPPYWVPLDGCACFRLQKLLIRQQKYRLMWIWGWILSSLTLQMRELNPSLIAKRWDLFLLREILCMEFSFDHFDLRNLILGTLVISDFYPLKCGVCRPLCRYPFLISQKIWRRSLNEQPFRWLLWQLIVWGRFSDSRVGYYSRGEYLIVVSTVF